MHPKFWVGLDFDVLCKAWKFHTPAWTTALTATKKRVFLYCFLSGYCTTHTHLNHRFLPAARLVLNYFAASSTSTTIISSRFTFLLKFVIIRYYPVTRPTPKSIRTFKVKVGAAAFTIKGQIKAAVAFKNVTLVFMDWFCSNFACW